MFLPSGGGYLDFKILNLFCIKKKFLSVFAFVASSLIVAQIFVAVNTNAKCTMDIQGSMRCNAYFNPVTGELVSYVCEDEATPANKCIAVVTTIR